MLCLAGTGRMLLRHEGCVSSLLLILSIIVVCSALIIGMIVFVILARLVLRLTDTYNKKRDTFFEDLVLQAVSEPQSAQRLHEIARCVYAGWWGGAPGLRPFDNWSLERSLLWVAAELRGSERQILTDIFEDAGGLARGLRQLRALRYHKRLSAVQKLRIMHSRRAVPGLIRALNDRSQIVRNAAVRALGELGDEQSYPFLLNALEDQAHWSTFWVADSVLAAGSAIVPLLVERFAMLRDPQLRTVYVRLLGLLRAPEVSDHLLLLLDAPEIPLRIAAINTLSAIADAEIVSRLRVMLDDPHWEVRAAAAKALGALMDLESVPTLERLLGDSVYLVRYSAAHTLITLGNEGQVVLRAVIEADQPYAHAIAQQVLSLNAQGLL
jgi:hypothetical protein